MEVSKGIGTWQSQDNLLPFPLSNWGQVNLLLFKAKKPHSPPKGSDAQNIQVENEGWTAFIGKLTNIEIYNEKFHPISCLERYGFQIDGRKMWGV